MTRRILAAALVLCLTPSLAAAGKVPFGGDDSGCVPADPFEYTCGKRLAQALGKLVTSVIKCHLVQAGQAFKTGHSSNGFDNAEDNCSEGPSNTSAKAKFDALVAKGGCRPYVVAAVQARRDVLLADQSNPDSLDALNGSFFCDSTSGLTIAEPGGDDAGFIPADSNGYRCAMGVAKAYAKLVVSTYKCHVKMAKAAFKGQAFDEEACEEAAPMGALARYNAQVQKYVAAGICPACLASSGGTLGSDAVADLDAQNGEPFACPPPPSPCNDLGGGQCSDTCPNPGDECLFVPSGYDLPSFVPDVADFTGQDDCRCVPSFLLCENIGAAVCMATGGTGALCPNASEQCTESGGSCTCQ